MPLHCNSHSHQHWYKLRPKQQRPLCIIYSKSETELRPSCISTPAGTYPFASHLSSVLTRTLRNFPLKHLPGLFHNPERCGRLHLHNLFMGLPNSFTHMHNLFEATQDSFTRVESIHVYQSGFASFYVSFQEEPEGRGVKISCR